MQIDAERGDDMKDTAKPAEWVGTPLFKDFKEREIKRVLKLGMLEWKGQGVPVFLRGDTGQDMFLIADGKIRIHDFVDGQDVQIAMLGPGELFGEMAALSGKPRSAHASTAVDSMLLTFTEEDLERFFRKDPKVGAKLMANLFNIGVSRLLKTLIKANNRISQRLAPADSEDMPKLFAGIKTDLKKQILSSGDIKVYRSGQVLFKRGQLGDRLYVVLRGEVHVVVPIGGTTEVMAVVDEGGMLGEVALATHGKRTAAALAAKPTQTLELSAEAIDKLLRRHPKAATRLLLNLFRIVAARLRTTTQLAFQG